MQKELRDHLKDNPKLKHHEHREKVHGIKRTVMSKLDNLDELSLKGLDERTILEMDKALTKIYKEYPYLRGIINEVHLIDKGTAVVEIDIQNKGITVSLGINKNLTIENSKSINKRLYKQHKWTKKPGIEDIIKHEMGHVLNYD